MKAPAGPSQNLENRGDFSDGCLENRGDFSDGCEQTSPGVLVYDSRSSVLNKTSAQKVKQVIKQHIMTTTPLTSYVIPVAPTCTQIWVLLLLSLIGVLIFWFGRWPGNKVGIKPIRASAFKPEIVPEKIDTIVIGSGSGGCACANLLAQSGQRVLVLDQHPDRTGGCTHSFRLEGCEWDTGLHYTSMGMSQKTCRPGALLNFMTKGKQHWSK